MTTFYDDEKLAAYALGELDETERAAVEAYVKENDSAQKTVAEFRAAARLAAGAFQQAAAPALTEQQREEIRGQARNASVASAAHRFGDIKWWAIGFAAAAILLFVIIVPAMSRMGGHGGIKSAGQAMRLSYEMKSAPVHFAAPAAAPAPAPPMPSAEQKDQLNALGYISTSAAPEPGGNSAGKELREKSDNQPEPATTEQTDSKDSGHYLIKTANISIETDNPQEAAKKLTESVVAAGGYVSNLREQANGLGQHTVTLQVRVPAEKMDNAMQTLESLGRILNRQVNTQDVTEEYVDTDARIRNLQKTEERLLDHLSKAVLIESTLKIEQELTRVREQLERLQGHLRSMANRVHFSTIDVTFTEEPKAGPVTPVETFSTGQVFTEAARSLVAFAQWTWVKAIWLAVWAPVWGVVALAAGIVYRRARKK